MTRRTEASIRQLARLIGVSEKAVRKARAAGVFSEESVGRGASKAPVVRDLNLAVAEWERSGRRLRGTAGRSAREFGSAPALGADVGATAPTSTAGEGAVPADGFSGDLEPDDDSEIVLPGAAATLPTSLVNAQTMAMIERARKLRLENDEREGRLLDAGKVEKETFEFARVLRESVLNVPARLAGELAAESDASVVYRKLDVALREALEATATTLEAMAVQ